MAPARAVPLVGRDAELSRLSGWVADLAAGHGHAALIDGEPGIGKTALLHASAEMAADTGCAVFRLPDCLLDPGPEHRLGSCDPSAWSSTWQAPWASL
jgi:AAA ATPase domain